MTDRSFDSQVPTGKKISVKTKVLRELEKKPVDGVYPSKGYGFADFSSHAMALAALRELNNNPAYSSYAQGGAAALGAKKGLESTPRLIIEFAIENQKMLQKKKLRQLKEQAEVKAKPAAPEVQEEEKPEKKGRGKRQREKKLLKGKEGPSGDAVAGPVPKKQKVQVKEMTAVGRERERLDLAKEKGKKPRGRAGGEESGRKRSRDELNDILSEIHDAQAASKSEKSKKKQGKEEEDFSQMVSAYKQRLFGASSCNTKTADPSATPARKRERWFDLAA